MAPLTRYTFGIIYDERLNVFFLAFKEMMNELENPNQKQNKPTTPINDRPYTMRPQKITISTSSEGETLETPSKHKKGKTKSERY